MAKPSRELQERLDQIERMAQVDTKKNEFFMAASHQLKGPVAVIQWCLQCVLEDGKLDNKSREMVLKSLAQANAMSRLISDMLHVFRLVTRKDGTGRSYELVDVNAVVAEVCELYELVAHQQKVHLVKGPMEVLPAVYAERSYLHQAITNLVDNAIKYSPADSQVSISSRVAKDGFVEIEVRDHGIGISEADQAQLFREFFRSQAARDVTEQGTGLGLVLVKQVVEEFGGSVQLHSRVHKGSTFVIRLPTAKHRN